MRDLENILSKAPLDPESGKRLALLVEEAKSIGGKEYTLDHLAHRVRPPSLAALVLAMVALVQEGIVQEIIRVESPTAHAGIADFHALAEVPEELYDDLADVHIRVHPDDLHIIYRL